MMALFFKWQDSVTVSQLAQYQDLETDAAKWDLAIINCIIYTWAFAAVMCQNVFCEAVHYVEQNSLMNTKCYI